MKTYLFSLRLFNTVFASLCVLLGALLAGDVNIKTLLAMLVVFLITGAGNVFNDYTDREVDKKIHPERPIPSGAIKPENALLFSVFLFITGNLIALLMGRIFFWLSLLASIVLFLYSLYLKKIPVLSNVLVSILAGLVFPFGSLTSGKLSPAIFPFIFALLINFSREILKDMVDKEGDRVRKVKSIPIIYGERKAVRIVKCVLLILVMITFLPYKIYGKDYLLAIIFLVNLPLLFLILRLREKRKVIEWSEKFVKAMMVTGYISLLLGI